MGLDAKVERHVATSLGHFHLETPASKKGPMILPAKLCRTRRVPLAGRMLTGKSEQHSLESVEPDDVVSTVARDMLQKDGRLAEMAEQLA